MHFLPFSNYTQRAIASMVDVGQKPVSRIIWQHAQTGSVVPRRKSKCGRKLKTAPKDEGILLRNSKMNPRKSSFELQKDLAYSGVHVSSAIVRHRLIEASRKAKNPTK